MALYIQLGSQVKCKVLHGPSPWLIFHNMRQGRAGLQVALDNSLSNIRLVQPFAERRQLAIVLGKDKMASSSSKDLVRNWLKQNHLDEYIVKFIDEHGYDDLKQLSTMNENDVQELIVDVGLHKKKGHCKRFLGAMEILKSTAKNGHGSDQVENCASRNAEVDLDDKNSEQDRQSHQLREGSSKTKDFSAVKRE